MVINHGSRTLYSQIAIQLHLFARDTAAVGNSHLYGSITHRQILYFVERLALVGNSQVKNGLSELHEVSILCNEVGFTLQRNDSSKVACSLGKYTTFRSLAVRTLGSYGLALLTDDLHSLVEVAFSLSQCILAVHHTSTRHLAELGNISH